jgi:hypothetical protein
MGEWERQMQADRLAVVQQARKLVAELDSYLAATRVDDYQKGDAKCAHRSARALHRYDR